jgi:hypothetical protein
MVNYISERAKGIDKIQWRLLVSCGQNPRKKIAPEDVVGKSRIAEETVLNKAIFLSRTDASAIKMSRISRNEFVERSTWASFRELKRLFDLLCQISANSAGSTNIPSIETMIRRTRETYHDCFRDVTAYHIQVPFGAGPRELVRKIEEV